MPGATAGSPSSADGEWSFMADNVQLRGGTAGQASSGTLGLTLVVPSIAPDSVTAQPPASILAAFHQRSTSDADRPALLVDRGEGYTSLTWRQITTDVEAASQALRRLGLETGEHVAVLGENCYEWLITDLALQAVGAVSVPLHLSLSVQQIEQQLRHGDVRWAIVADANQLAKLDTASAALRGIIVWRPVTSLSHSANHETPVHAWIELLRQPAAGPALLPTAAEQTDPASLATIIYTSGTTGDPKGVMLSHGNLAFNAWATWTSFANPRSERRFGLLPWSHAFARTCDLYAWIVSGTELIVGRSRETAIADIQATQPTYMNGVPYFFQKVQRGLEAAGAGDQSGAARKFLGGQLRACCSGGAPLPTSTFDFYQRQGLPVLEGYGMTEASPVIATCTERDFRPGSVGRPLRDVEVRIAGDGEVLTRGRHVMLGYFKDPAATSETLHDGWLHTGDLGRLDADGFLYLTGRKKELLALSTGRKVSPALLEALLTQDPLIEQAVVVGEGEKELGALVVVNRSLAETDDAAALRERLQITAARLLSERPPHEQIRRFAILPQPLTQETGELSAKQSLCRTVIATRHAERIAALFRK